MIDICSNCGSYGHVLDECSSESAEYPTSPMSAPIPDRAPPHPDRRFVMLLAPDPGDDLRMDIRSLRRGDVFQLFEPDGSSAEDCRVWRALGDYDQINLCVQVEQASVVIKSIGEEP